MSLTQKQVALVQLFGIATPDQQLGHDMQLMQDLCMQFQAFDIVTIVEAIKVAQG